MQKSSWTWWCLIENMYPHFQRLQAIFLLKRNQKPFLWLSTLIDQRVFLNWLVIRENLIFFLPSSLYPQWRGHWWEQEYITKRSLEFLLGLFKNILPTQVQKTSHFIETYYLKIERAEHTSYIFLKETLSFSVRLQKCTV